MPPRYYLTFCLTYNFVSVSLACMAMVVTHPSTTRPPQVSTTSLPPTTTSTTSTTTTSTVPPCVQCDDVLYEAPDAAVCGGVLFDCTDAALLMQATTSSGCKKFACGNGAKMFAHATSGDAAVVVELTCSQESPPKYEDTSTPAKSFPDKARVFCKKEYMCDCDDVTYSTADPEAQPATTLAPASPNVVGEFGCDTKDCGRLFQLQTADHSKILHSITCNPKLPGIVDKAGLPVTQPVACYDCKCMLESNLAILCPSGHFCKLNYPPAVSNCGSICSPGDLIVTYNGGKSVKDGLTAPEAEVFCDGEVWRPFGIQEALMYTTCATPVELMTPAPPAEAMCPALTDLTGGTFSDLVYTTTVSNGVRSVFAVCRNGLVNSERATTNEEIVTAYLICKDNEWTSQVNDGVNPKATCKPDSCTALLVQAGFSAPEIASLKVDDASPGHCRISCANGAVMKITRTTEGGTSMHDIQDAFVAFRTSVYGLDLMTGESVNFGAQKFTC